MIGTNTTSTLATPSGLDRSVRGPQQRIAGSARAAILGLEVAGWELDAAAPTGETPGRFPRPFEQAQQEPGGAGLPDDQVGRAGLAPDPGARLRRSGSLASRVTTSLPWVAVSYTITTGSAPVGDLGYYPRALARAALVQAVLPSETQHHPAPPPRKQ